MKIASLFVSAVVAWSTMLAAEETYVLDTSYSPQLPEGLTLGPVPGITFNSHGYMILSHRGPRPILVYDEQGHLVHMFGDDELTQVHGTRVDADDNIWVTDHRNHTVIKYDPSGKVLRKWGVRDEKGEDPEHFNRPTDVAFAANGDFFVADGYGNSRVVKFDRDGKYLKAWGVKGTETGQFNLPHCLQLDHEGKLHVADRENDRVQVFDTDGNFIRTYGGFAPFGIFLAPDQTVFVADGRAHQVRHVTQDGKVLSVWGSEGTEPGQLKLPHGIAVDRRGAVYVTEIEGKRIQKFVLKK